MNKRRLLKLGFVSVDSWERIYRKELNGKAVQYYLDDQKVRLYDTLARNTPSKVIKIISEQHLLDVMQQHLGARLSANVSA